MGANSFLAKPHDFEDFSAMMLAFNSFWLHHNRHPPIHARPAKPIS
jgi:hypothetical protein